VARPREGVDRVESDRRPMDDQEPRPLLRIGGVTATGLRPHGMTAAAAFDDRDHRRGDRAAARTDSDRGPSTPHVGRKLTPSTL